jgi:serine protease
MHVRRTGSIASVMTATAVVIAGIVAASAPASAVDDSEAAVETAGAATTDQVIVTYADAGMTLDAANAERSGGRGTKAVRRLGRSSEVVKLPAPLAGEELDGVMRSLATQPGVIAVEPDAIMQPLDAPNDPDLPLQWDLTDPAVSGAYGINAAAAWDINAGSAGVRIAVIDTGYLNHADLAGRFVGGYDFVSDSRIANDGNARDASALDPGDWITSTEASAGFFAGCTVDDSSWHGTHVAGTIGAATNNGVGIAGINRVSPIVPVRVLGKCGGYTSDIVDGMRWAAGLPVTGVPANPNPARVLSLSLGGSGACSATYQNAVDAITAAGAVVVVAAGNSNANAANYSPASCNGVVTVAATGKAGSRSYYSNFGASVEIAAPGGDRIADDNDTILSTLNTGLTTPGADAYVRYQGTSMATPHVSGVVSLMLSVNPALTPAQVTQILQSSARAFPAGSTCIGQCGAGLLDAAAAVTGAGSPPPPPPGPGAFDKSSPANNATGQATRPTLRWGASSGATSYQVCIDRTLNGACDGTWTSVTGTAASTTTLVRRATYEWQVRAVNANGTTDANAGAWWRFTVR